MAAQADTDRLAEKWQISWNFPSLCGVLVYRGVEIRTGCFSNDTEWITVGQDKAQMVCDGLNALAEVERLQHEVIRLATERDAALRENERLKKALEKLPFGPHVERDGHMRLTYWAADVNAIKGE